MKKKLTAFLFIFTVIFLALIFIYRIFIYKETEEKNNVSVIIPQANSTEMQSTNENYNYEDDVGMISLIPLQSDETLLSVVSMDFDNDGFDDQVNAIRTSASPYISLLVGLYNPSKSTYERSMIISTQISHVLTFSFTGIDLIGNHTNALVYQGFAENGDSLLQAFLITNRNGKPGLNLIANFRGDGIIFIQQLDRYDAYEKSQVKGLSYPIWVYTTDSSKPESNEQLQICYDWNEDERKYTETKRIRVAGSRLQAKELAKIQDGTIETFAKFLDGLWCKINSSSSDANYVFFDWQSQEIIFFNTDFEEVYRWVHSNLRRNGVYITSINQQIENLHRSINVSLISIDEIRLRLQDDVRLLINESNVWDGEYKKLNFEQDYFKNKNKDSKTNSVSITKKIEENIFWTTADGSVLKFENGNFTSESEGSLEKGYYTFIQIQNEYFIQFRCETSALYKGVYKLSYAPQSQNSNQLNYDVIILQPYTLSPNGVYAQEKRSIILNCKND